MDDTVPYVPWELIEREILAWLPFTACRLVGATCRRLADTWALAVTEPPPMAFLRDSNLLRIPAKVYMHGERLYLPFPDAALCRFPALRTLDLTNQSSISDNCLSRLTALTELNLRGAGRVTAQSVSQLPHLTSLDLSQCRLYWARDQLTQLTALRRLGLQGNLCIVDEDLCVLTRLTALDLGYNETITDNGVSALTALCELSVRGWKNNVTHHGITRLQSLTRLDLSGNDRIGNGSVKALASLTELIFSASAPRGINPDTLPPRIRCISSDPPAATRR